MLDKIKNAFTLAEVLITLVIIGVIAAATIPTLINKTQKQETVAGVKKAYSTLQSAVHKIALEKGYPQGDYSFITDANSFFDDFAKTVHAIKRCNGLDGCIPLSVKALHGRADGIANYTNAVITSDGFVYTFATSVSPRYSGIPDEDNGNLIGIFWVDVNGHKGPQTFGKDLFFFVLIRG